MTCVAAAVIGIVSDMRRVETELEEPRGGRGTPALELGIATAKDGMNACVEVDIFHMLCTR